MPVYRVTRDDLALFEAAREHARTVKRDARRARRRALVDLWLPIVLGVLAVVPVVGALAVAGLAWWLVCRRRSADNPH